MAYDITLAQINSGIRGPHQSNTSWGFPPNTNFHTLLMSYWMCGPWYPGPGTPGSPGIWPAFAPAEFFGFGPGANDAITGNPFIFFTNQATWGAHPYTGFFSGNIPPPQPTSPVGCLLHMMMSVDTHAQVVQVYINDQPVTVTGTWSGTPPFDFNVGSINIWDWDVSNVIATGIHPAMADVWISNTPAFVDLSVTANRRLFITAGLRPVDLGDTGTVPFGYQPAMYMSIRPGGVAGDILINRGLSDGSWIYSDNPPTFQTDGMCVLPPAPPGVVTLTDAELVFNSTPAFVDFTVEANRRLFISSIGTPQWMGANGALAFNNAQPAIYLSAVDNIPTNFAQNEGYSGPFAITGVIYPAGSTPGCSSYVTTVAAGPASNPEWRLTVSDDGGRTWSTLVKPRSIGETGEYLKRLRWLKMGQFRQRIIKLECTDPVRRNIIGFYSDTTEGMG
jgi:hypothetical protein